MSAKNLALLIVSHSLQLSGGVRELVNSLHPAVYVGACGGGEGSLGITTETVAKSLQEARQVTGDNSQIIVLTDLGTSALAVSNAIDTGSKQVVLARGPLVEGAIAAAGAISTGADLAEVLQVIIETARPWVEQAAKPAAVCDGFDPTAPREVVLGADLQARPAAVLARAVCDFEAEVKVDEAEATSVLALMRLDLKAGHMAVISATGPDTAAALDRVEELLKG